MRSRTSVFASSHALGVTLLEGRRPAPRGNFVPAPQAQRSAFPCVTLLEAESRFSSGAILKRSDQRFVPFAPWREERFWGTEQEIKV